ncbi:MAG: tetratricopeptide repeat protein [Candidatus Marinimicrobia bacterium]|nr:tetratricopeptide repeat protein [Candidatus Neomarinimicrobiota bacterium]
MILEKQAAANYLPVYDQKILDLIYSGDVEQARWVAEESYEYSRTTYGDSHLETAKTLNNLAWVYDLLGYSKAAEACYKRAIELKISVCGQRSTELIPSMENLMSLYLLNGDYKLAEKLLMEMINIVRNHPEPWCFREAVYLSRIAEINLKLGRINDADGFYHECIAFVERTLPLDHPNLGRAFANIADFYRQIGKFRRAEFYYMRAYAVLKRSLSVKHADVQNVLEKIRELRAQPQTLSTTDSSTQ